METVKRHIRRDDFCVMYFLDDLKGDIITNRYKIPASLAQRYKNVMVELEEIQNELEDIYYKND